MPISQYGWTVDPEGLLRRETVHRMTRRCLNWDYCGRGVYLITLELNDRSRPLLGRLACLPIHGLAPEAAIDLLRDAAIEPTELGAKIETHFRRISEFSPEIEVIGVQLMPEHLHGVVRVAQRMAKPLGEQLRGFKIGATKIARDLGIISGIDAGERSRGRGLFADGFVDTILGDDDAVKKGVAYMLDNPRRLAIKRAFPELFKVLGDLCQPIDGLERPAHFAAIGNRSLLKLPHILQVQVSRSDFAYKRDAGGAIERSAIEG